jgi:hypothetical protein
MRPCLFPKSASRQILRHSQIAVTMDVYSQVTSDSTLRALKALGERLEGH